MSQGMLHKLISVLIEATKSLGLQCRCADLERIAVLVHRIMSYQSRQFHTLEHVFSFLEGADDITVLAAIFHDLVYFQIDDGFPPDVAELLERYVECRADGLYLRHDHQVPDQGSTDPAFGDCLRVFALSEGMKLPPFAGTNEFLSALCMEKLSENHISRKDRLAIAACIEASIPFQGADARGLSRGEALEERMEHACRAAGLELDRGEIVSMVHRAIDFANKDVKDFALADPARFLSNTWKLLPESNESLRSKGAFSVSEYRAALQKMLGFFRSLDPANIYHSYREVPDAAEISRLRDAAEMNLKCAVTYLRAKLLAVAFVEATAMVSGGDAPMALFMGDVPEAGNEIQDLMSFLTPVPAPAWLDGENPVYRLLKDGRLDESSFDLRNSPLALRFYHRLAPSVWNERVISAERFFAGELSAGAFLEGFQAVVRDEILEACARLVPTRTVALRSWMEARRKGDRSEPGQ